MCRRRGPQCPLEWQGPSQRLAQGPGSGPHPGTETAVQVWWTAADAATHGLCKAHSKKMQVSPREGLPCPLSHSQCASLWQPGQGCSERGLPGGWDPAPQALGSGPGCSVPFSESGAHSQELGRAGAAGGAGLLTLLLWSPRQLLPPPSTQGAHRKCWVSRAPGSAGDSHRALAEGLGAAAALGKGFVRAQCSPGLWSLGTPPAQGGPGLAHSLQGRHTGPKRAGTCPEPHSQPLRGWAGTCPVSGMAWAESGGLCLLRSVRLIRFLKQTVHIRHGARGPPPCLPRTRPPPRGF